MTHYLDEAGQTSRQDIPFARGAGAPLNRFLLHCLPGARCDSANLSGRRTPRVYAADAICHGVHCFSVIQLTGRMGPSGKMWRYE